MKMIFSHSHKPNNMIPLKPKSRIITTNRDIAQSSQFIDPITTRKLDFIQNLQNSNHSCYSCR